MVKRREPTMNRGRRRWLAGTLLCLFLAAPAVLAQQPVKQPIGYDAFDGWRSIQGTRISRDGAWLAYALTPQDGDGEVVARNLKTGSEHRHPRGNSPAITFDGRFVVFAVAPHKADVDKAKKEKKRPEDQPKAGLAVLNLSNGEVFAVDRVKSFKLPEKSGRFVAYLKEAEKKPAEEKKEPEAKPAEAKEEPKKKEKKKDPGTDLVVRDLTKGSEVVIPEAVDYAWNESGTLLAYTVSSVTPRNDGAFALDPVAGTTTTLASGRGNYKNLVLDKQGRQIAFMTDRGDYDASTPAFVLFHWTHGSERATELISAKTPGIPEGRSVSEHGRVEFSEDGARLFFGTARIPAPEPEDGPEPVKVDIWHWKDPLLQPMQRVRADQAKKQSFRAVVSLADRRLTQLACEEVPEIELNPEATAAIGTSDVPYRQLVSWDGRYQDIYILELTTGSRRKIIEQSPFGATLSPAGRYVLYYDSEERNWLAIAVRDGRKINLTAKADVQFDSETSDTPDRPRPYGIAGWTEDDRSVLLYDRYDIWEARPESGELRKVTNGIGREEGIVFRYTRLDPEVRTIASDKPMLLSAVDERTKASGYYRLAPGGKGRPVKLVMLDKAFGNLQQAREADTLVFTLSRFEEFPNLWTSDGSFGNMRKLSDANPQQAQYIWGRSELVDFHSVDGTPLRAILTRPEDFDPSKKYPMMVYIYEQLTGGLHRHVAPSPGTSINVTRYVSNGYIVLQPDIVYETGYPGESAMKCVVPAVQRIVEMGFVDPERIGIQGHSWGGYQISHMITRTNIFRAVQAGASVVNMVSAYGGIRWGTGMSRAFQYEKTQSRIGAPPWERSLQFIENSPIFWVEKVRTPYLTIHNDEDDAVPWYQGIEFFTALRRLGKEAYMFNYNGEKHGLRERENQKHWTIHQDEFFDHYLKGAPLPEWMAKGVPYLERGRRDVSPLFRRQLTDKN
jgi:dipeptidyl aminopeptidase/acylaminoacyl peptidase